MPIALDDEGPLPGEVERALNAGARALVVTDRAQNPTGAAIGAVRAEELRSVLAGHRGALLIEDDHGHAIVDLPLHPLAGATDRWAFVRSVAKAYGPDIAPLADAVAQRRNRPADELRLSRALTVVSPEGCQQALAGARRQLHRLTASSERPSAPSTRTPLRRAMHRT